MANRDTSIKWEIIHEWWEKLEDNKGERAELRHVCKPLDALLLPQTIRFINVLLPGVRNNEQMLRLGAIAGVLSHVKQAGGMHPARAMATPRDGGGAAPVSEARFRRLLACEDLDELYVSLIRLLPLVGNQAHITALASAIYWWKKGRDFMRYEWAREYFGNAPQS